MSRGRKRKTTGLLPAMAPTPEQLARGGWVAAPAENVAGSPLVYRNTQQTPLERLHHRGNLTDDQYSAGTWLRGKYHGANGSVIKGCNLSEFVTRQPAQAHEPAYREDCRRSYNAALAAVGRQHAAVLTRVVVDEFTASEMSEGLGYCREAGTALLCEALNALHDWVRRGQKQMNKPLPQRGVDGNEKFRMS